MCEVRGARGVRRVREVYTLAQAHAGGTMCWSGTMVLQKLKSDVSCDARVWYTIDLGRRGRRMQRRRRSLLHTCFPDASLSRTYRMKELQSG